MMGCCVLVPLALCFASPALAVRSHLPSFPHLSRPSRSSGGCSSATPPSAESAARVIVFQLINWRSRRRWWRAGILRVPVQVAQFLTVTGFAMVREQEPVWSLVTRATINPKCMDIIAQAFPHTFGPELVHFPGPIMKAPYAEVKEQQSLCGCSFF